LELVVCPSTPSPKSRVGHFNALRQLFRRGFSLELRTPPTSWWGNLAPEIGIRSQLGCSTVLTF